MSAETLLQYGNWSGPGWTAGKRDDSFDSAGVDRILSDADLAVRGIDTYDNFVAKAHDMNEYAAQATLRDALAALELIDNDRTEVGDSPAYTTKLKLSEGGDERSRFASFQSYLADLQARGPSEDQLAALGMAFALYYRHVALSNHQFALDFSFNRPSLLRMVLDISSFEFTLPFGPHLFLGEAAVLLRQAVTASHAVDSAPPSDGEWRRYLRDHFITPNDDAFAAPDGLSYVPILSRDGLATVTHAGVTELFQALVNAANRSGRAGDVYHRYRPRGASSIADAMLALSYPA